MEHRGQSLSFRNGGMVLKRMLLTRDFWSGMLFAAFGIAALAFGHDLRIGSAARMELGFVPPCARRQFAFRLSLDGVVVDDGPLAEQAFAGGEIPFRAVARMAGLSFNGS
jgi:hypothetical protein